MNVDVNRAASVLWVAKSNFTLHAAIKPHSHDYYHLFFVSKGPATLLVEDTRQTLVDGEFILVPPGVRHGMDAVEVPVARFCEVKFVLRSQRLERLLHSLPYFFPRNDFVATLVEETIRESSRGDAFSETVASDYLLVLINYLYRKFGEQERPAAKYIDTTGYSKVSQQIVHYLEENYAREIPLQEVADKVGFNKNYICSLFRKDSGMTIGNCTTLIRIRKAAEYISFSDMDLAQVAGATGFSNLSHFNRIFKKVVGIPPGQYRRMFPADILVPGKVTPEYLEQQGFISAVLGGKRLSAEELSAHEGWGFGWLQLGDGDET